MSREHVESYKAITRNLDRAIGQHGLESPEADALRDESDPPWDAMTEAERDEAREWAGKCDERRPMVKIQIVAPGSEVSVNDIPARIAEVKFGTALKPEYLLSWWDGRSLCTGWFDEDEFQLKSDREGQRAGIGFTRVSI